MTSMTSAMKITALAAAALLGSAGIMSYDHGAGAQAAEPSPHPAPGHSVEVIAPATVVVSTAHYQAELQLKCSGVDRTASCAGHFRKIGLKHRLNITRISCFYDANIGSTFSNGSISLIDSAGALVLQEITPLDFSSSEGAHSLNAAVDLQIEEGQHLYADVVLATGVPNFAFCTATGILSTLQ